MLWAGRLGIFSLSKGYDFAYLKWFAWSGSFLWAVFWGIVLFSRLLSQGKRTLERNSVSFNGHMHKEHCMDCNHQIPRCLLNVHISQNSIRWLKKPKEELKLQGEQQSFVLAWYRKWILTWQYCYTWVYNSLTVKSIILCRLRELHTLKGHVESVVRLKGLDIDTIQQAYTV